MKKGIIALALVSCVLMLLGCSKGGGVKGEIYYKLYSEKTQDVSSIPEEGNMAEISKLRGLYEEIQEQSAAWVKRNSTEWFVRFEEKGSYNDVIAKQDEIAKERFNKTVQDFENWIQANYISKLSDPTYGTGSFKITYKFHLSRLDKYDIVSPVEVSFGYSH